MSTLPTVSLPADRDGDHARVLEGPDWLESARDELLQAALHDLRNHIGVVQGWAHIAALGIGDAAAMASAAASLKRSVRAQIELIDDLDETLHADGVADADATTIDLVALAHQIAEALKPNFTAREVTLEIRALEPAHAAACSPRRVERLVRRAVCHALNHCQRGGAVRLVIEERDGRARILVSDSGSPLAAGPRRPLERLRRADAVDRPDGRTLVLDLALIRATADLIGASARAEPCDSGVTLTLDLPGPMVRPGSNGHP